MVELKGASLTERRESRDGRKQKGETLGLNDTVTGAQAIVSDYPLKSQQWLLGYVTYKLYEEEDASVWDWIK